MSQPDLLFDLTLPRPPALNHEALDTVLRQEFGEAITGTSDAGTVFLVHFVQAPDPTQRERTETLVLSHNASAKTTEQLAREAIAVRRDETKTRFQQLTQGLGALSVEDRSYAITARIMAHKDGATNAVILGINSKATAQAYVTGKSEWTALNAATRNMLADVLETLAGIVQVAVLTVE